MRISFIVFVGCLSMTTGFAQRSEFSWLLGTWKLKDKNVFETWRIGTDGKTLTGNSFRVSGTDTVRLEQVKIIFVNDQFHYVPDVEGDQPAVDFPMKSYSANGFIAENLMHDFPKTIRYHFFENNGSDRIEASIEGDGKVIPYHFERVK